MDSYSRFGFISYIFKKLEEIRPYYGKIVAQKIIYFLQEAEGVNLDYNFSFYHYGPYCDELARDIQLMEMNNIIKTSSDPQDKGYAIYLNEEEAIEFIEDSADLIKKYNDKITHAIKDFGRYKPSPLELAATIHYVYKELKSGNGHNIEKDEVIKIVKGLKPKFEITQIDDSYSNLLTKGYLN